VASPRQSVTWSGPHAQAFNGSPEPPASDHAGISAWVLQTLRAALPTVAISAVGHRVVHGGAQLDRPCLIDKVVLAEIQRLSPLAPNHQPQAIAAINAVAEAWPEVPQVACF